MNYFDCHADTLTELWNSEDTLDHNSGDLDLQRIGAFVENYTQIFAVWKDAEKINRKNPEKEFFRLYDRARAYLMEENRKIIWCGSRSGKRSYISWKRADSGTFETGNCAGCFSSFG